MMIRPIKVKALKDYKIWIKFSDGREGEIDLSDYVGKGIFKSWKDYKFFQSVYIGDNGEIAWGKDIDLCPDSLYLKLTNQRPEHLFPSLKEESINA